VLTSIAGRVIAVSGAAGSLGPTVVERLASAGAVLSLAGRDGERLEALAARVGGSLETQAVDLLDPEATRAWADGIVARHGRVDALCHLVGGWRGGRPIEEQPAELLVQTLQNATRAFARHLLASGRGRFLIVSSGQAQAPTSANASYAAAKAAAEAWTLALADRFRGSGATANIVVVGAIVTPAMRAEKPGETFAGFTPAEEIAEAIAYLVSDAAASMNGRRLVLR
jgi:NAD(P)-dependent dehydrogenase (short-subunit alcohol dehydrogenase family)